MVEWEICAAIIDKLVVIFDLLEQRHQRRRYQVVEVFLDYAPDFGDDGVELVVVVGRKFEYQFYLCREPCVGGAGRAEYAELASCAYDSHRWRVFIFEHAEHVGDHTIFIEAGSHGRIILVGVYLAYHSDGSLGLVGIVGKLACRFAPELEGHGHAGEEHQVARRQQWQTCQVGLFVK